MLYVLSWSVMFILLAPWISPELALGPAYVLSALSPAIEMALDQVPARAGGLSVGVSAVWGVGSAAIVILGLVCSRLITALRRRASPRTLEAVQWTP